MKKIIDFFHQVAGCRLQVAGRMGKRGSLLDEESVKVIMAVVVFAGIVFLLVKLFSPVFNVADETAESYFETLERAIDEIPSSFFMMDNGDKDLNFYLVYFGDVFVFGDFVREIDSEKNVICVCSQDGDAVFCKYCKGLKYPASFNGNVKQWAIGEGVNIAIGHTEGHYVFSSK